MHATVLLWLVVALPLAFWGLLSIGCGDSEGTSATAPGGASANDGSSSGGSSPGNDAHAAAGGAGGADAPDRWDGGTSADAGASDAENRDASEPDADADSDAPDAGKPDVAEPDSRPSDPCATDLPASTVGCNGEPPGPAPVDTPGGVCSPAAYQSGMCAGTTLFCAYRNCVLLCSPTASTEVSTGGCAAGFRCWDEGLLFFCFPDCRTNADCAGGNCLASGRCR